MGVCVSISSGLLELVDPGFNPVGTDGIGITAPDCVYVRVRDAPSPATPATVTCHVLDVVPSFSSTVAVIIPLSLP